MTQHRPEITGRKLSGTRMNRPIGDRLVYTVPEAGRLLGLGRNAAYDAAKRGDIPTIRMGRLLRVPKAAFHKLVGVEPPPSSIPGEAGETVEDADEDSEEDDDEAPTPVRHAQRRCRARVASFVFQRNHYQKDADRPSNRGNPGDLGANRSAPYQAEKASGALLRTASSHRRCRHRRTARRHADFLMSAPGTYGPVLTAFFRSSGKGPEIRTAIYPLHVFPNVTPWRLRSCRGASSPQESVP